MNSLNSFESEASFEDVFSNTNQGYINFPKEINELITLFEKVCNKVDATSMDHYTKTIDGILLNVSELNFSGKLNHKQLSKIAKLSAIIYPCINSRQTQQNIKQFLQQNFGLQGMYSYLKIEETMKQTDQIFDELAHFTLFDNGDALKNKIWQSVQAFSALIDHSYKINDRICLLQLKEHFTNTSYKFLENIKILAAIFTLEEQTSFVELIDNIAERLTDHYLDEFKLLKGRPGDKSIHPAYQQWFMTQAFLQQESENLNEMQQKKLEHLMLQAYMKAVGRPEAESQRGQSSPLFAGEQGYHREVDSKITTGCYQAYANALGFKDPLFVVDSPLLMEALRREMPDRGEFSLRYLDKLPELMDHLATCIANEPTNTFPLLIDISQLMKTENIPPSELSHVMESIEKEFEILMNSGRYPHAVKFAILNRIQFVSFIAYAGEHILLLPTFFNQANANEKITKIINHTGFRLNPSQTLEAWLKMESPQTIFSQEAIPQATLATKGTSIPTVCKNYQEFINQPIVRQFGLLAKEANAAPYLQIFPMATCRLLRGLAKHAVDECYGESMKDLLQISYFRILAAMREAIFQKDNYVAFHNHIELIHQELQAMLAVTEPYQEGDFANAVIKNLQKDPAIIPEGLNIQVHLKNSGMHSLASVLASVEAQKVTQRLNTMCQQDSYFENLGLLNSGQDYCSTILNTDGVFTEKLVKGDISRAKEPIDIFLCEFHHNISKKCQLYRPENIAEQIKYLHANGRLAEKCTVVIDTTINYEHADNIRSFLANPEILELIRKGKLNVVLLRSAQKYDMLGLDNYYGGITTTINDGTSFEEFKIRMDHPQDQLKGLNYQGLTHLQKYGKLDAYRKAIHENTKKLYKMLPKKLLNSQSFVVKMAQMEEENMFFLSIMFDERPMWSYIRPAFFERLIKLATDNQLPLTTRASFGFGNTNLSQISASMYRLNPGLDDDATLRMYARFFAELSNVLEKAEELLDDMEEDEIPPLLYRSIKNMQC